MRFGPLCPGFGLEATGVDLAQPLSKAAFEKLERAFFKGQVLVVRDQKLTAQEFAAFARRLGPPEPHLIDPFRHPDDPNVLILSNVKIDGKPSGLADTDTHFHTDCSYLQLPARATMLYSIEVPQAGGNTLFADQYAAYDSLDRALKRRIEPLFAIHRYGNRHESFDASRTAALPLTPEQQAKVPLVTHPLVRRHPVTGRRALYAVSGSSFGIVGMPDAEAVALLDELAAHATRPEYRYSHSYRIGDVVIWDNASLLNSATLVDPNHARTLWRITIGEPTPADAEVSAPAFAGGRM